MKRCPYLLPLLVLAGLLLLSAVQNQPPAP